jgi:hypothetical protein
MDESVSTPDEQSLEQSLKRRVMLWLTVAPLTGLGLGVLLGLILDCYTSGVAIGAGCGLTTGIGMTALLGHGVGEAAAAVRSAERRRATIISVVGLLMAALTSIITSSYIYMR